MTVRIPPMTRRRWFDFLLRAWGKALLLSALLLLGILSLIFPDEGISAFSATAFGSGLAACALVLALLLYRRLPYRSQAFFLTITEQGILMEIPASGIKQYRPWASFRGMQRQKSGLLLMFAQFALLVPQRDLRPGQVDALEATIRRCERCHGAPMPPPHSDAPAHPYSARPEQQREWARCLCPPRRLTACALLLCSFGAGVYADKLPLTLIAGLLLLWECGRFLMPTRRIRERTAQTRRFSVCAGHLRTTLEDGTWALAPTTMFTRARRLPHGILYNGQSGVAFMADEPLPGLPDVRGTLHPLRRGLIAALLLLSAAALLYGGGRLFL